MRLLNNVNLSVNELQNPKFHQLGSDPGSPVEGQFWYRTDLHRPLWRDAAATNQIYPFATANTVNTGVLRDANGDFSARYITATQFNGLASSATILATARSFTITTNRSGVTLTCGTPTFDGSAAVSMQITALTVKDTEVMGGSNANLLQSNGTNGAWVAPSTIPHSSFGTATADIAMGGFKITGHASITGADAATTVANKGYVDSVAAGLRQKQAVVFTTTGNITLSGTAYQANCEMGRRLKGAVQTVAAGGAAYTVGDILTVTGGTPIGGQNAQLRVVTINTGAILTVVIVNEGCYSTVPANNAAVTGGTGNSATFTLAWYGSTGTDMADVGERILVKNQTLPSDNGIYTVQTGAWTRDTDANTWALLVSAYVFVEEGATLSDTGWVCTADPDGTLAVTTGSAVTWVQFSSAGVTLAGNGLVKLGNTLHFAQSAGYTTNAIGYASSSSAMAFTATTAAQYNVLVAGAAGTPNWGQVALNQGGVAVTGTLTAGYGGTGIASYTAGDMIYASAVTTFVKIAIGSAGAWMTVSSGVPAWSTATGPMTCAVGDIEYGSASNVFSNLTKPATNGSVLGMLPNGTPGWIGDAATGKPLLSNGVGAAAFGSVLSVTYGGTGNTSNLTQYGVIYASTTTAQATTAAASTNSTAFTANNKFLVATSAANAAPLWLDLYATANTFTAGQSFMPGAGVTGITLDVAAGAQNSSPVMIQTGRSNNGSAHFWSMSQYVTVNDTAGNSDWRMFYQGDSTSRAWMQFSATQAGVYTLGLYVPTFYLLSSGATFQPTVSGGVGGNVTILGGIPTSNSTGGHVLLGGGPGGVTSGNGGNVYLYGGPVTSGTVGNVVLGNNSGGAVGQVQLSTVAASRVVTTDASNNLVALAPGTTTTVLHGNAGGLPSYGAVSLTADVTGTLPNTNGGTGQSTAFNLYGVTYASSTSVLATLASPGTTAQVLHGNAAGAPTWSAIGLTTDVTGTLPIGNGGTGTAVAPTQYGVIYATTAAAFASTAAGTATTLLHGNASGAPTFSAVSLTADVTGTLPYNNGGTGQASLFNLYGLTWASSTSVLATLASAGATTTVLHGNAAGAPTWGAISLTADVSGTLPNTNGGTGQASAFTQWGMTYASTTAVLASSATAASSAASFTSSNRFLVQNVTPGAPFWIDLFGSANVFTNLQTITFGGSAAGTTSLLLDMTTFPTNGLAYSSQTIDFINRSNSASVPKTSTWRMYGMQGGINAGAAVTQAASDFVIANSPNSGAFSNVLGIYNMLPGACLYTFGGNFTINPGAVAVSGTGYQCTVTGGYTPSGVGGILAVTGGNSGAGAGGVLTLAGGVGTGGLGGNVTIDGGTGTTAGNILIGTLNANLVRLGTVVANRLVSTDASQNLVPLALGTTTTLLHGNAAGLPTYSAVSLTADVTGTLPNTNGGTGQSSAFNLYGLTYASSTTVLATLASAGTTTTILHGNAAGAPTWAAVSLTADVTGTLPVGNGGTGTAVAPTQYGVIFASTAAAYTSTAAGGANTFLHGNGASAPTWAAVTLTSDVTGILPAGNGGTGSQYVGFTGPTALRSFTLPDMNATLCQKQTFSLSGAGATFNIAHTIPGTNLVASVVALTTGNGDTVGDVVFPDINFTAGFVNIYFKAAPGTNVYQVVLVG